MAKVVQTVLQIVYGHAFLNLSQNEKLWLHVLTKTEINLLYDSSVLLLWKEIHIFFVYLQFPRKHIRHRRQSKDRQHLVNLR